MSQLKSVNIPKPCHETWQAMTPVNGGRHCQSCSKTVTDFTKMNNDEIISYLSLDTHVCGRFNDGQLPHINNQLQPVNTSVMPKLKGWALLLAMLGPVTFSKLSAQNRPTTVQTHPDTNERVRSYMLGKVAVVQYKTITGIVTNKEDGTPIPGAMVTVPGYTNFTATSTAGKFSLSVPVTATEIHISYAGYATAKEGIDSTTRQVCDVSLRETPRYLVGDVIITKAVIRPPFVKRVYYRFIRQPHRFLKKKLASI